MGFATDWIAPLVARGLRAHVRQSDTEDDLHRPRVRVREDISNVQISADKLGFVQLLKWHGTGRYLSATVIDNCTQLRAVFSADAVAAWTKDNPTVPLSAIGPGTVLNLHCAEIRIKDCFHPPRVELYIQDFDVVGLDRQATPPRAPPVEIYAIPYVTHILNTFSQQRRENDMTTKVLPESSPGLASQAEGSDSEEDELSISQSKFLTQVPNPPLRRLTNRFPTKLQSPMPYTKPIGNQDGLLDLVPNMKYVARREQRPTGGLNISTDESIIKMNETASSTPTAGQAAPRSGPEISNVYESQVETLLQAVGPVGGQQSSCHSGQTSPQSVVGGGPGADLSNRQGRKAAGGDHCNQQQTEREVATPDPWAKWRGSLVSGRPCVPRIAQVIPRPQLKLLGTNDRWQPPLVGYPMVPGHVPLDLLNRLTAAADDERIESECLNSQQEPQAAQTRSERLEDSAEASTEAEEIRQQYVAPGVAAVSRESDSEIEEEPESIVNPREWPPSLPPSSAEPSPARKGTPPPPNSSMPASTAKQQLQISRTPALAIVTSSAPCAPKTSRRRPTSSSQRILATVGPEVRHVCQARSPVDLPQYEVSDDEKSTKEEAREPVSIPSPDQQLRVSQQIWEEMHKNAQQNAHASLERNMELDHALAAALSTTGQEAEAGATSATSMNESAADRQEYSSYSVGQVDVDQQDQTDMNQKLIQELPMKRSAPFPQDFSPDRKRVKPDSSISEQSTSSEDDDFQRHKARTREIRREFFAASRKDHEQLPSSREEFLRPQKFSTSPAQLALASHNANTRSPSPRSSSVNSCRQRRSGHSLNRQITLSTPVTSVSHRHAPGKAQSSLLPPASYWSSAQSHRFEDVMLVYRSAYPEYTGTSWQFAKSCQLIRRLSDQGRPLPQGVLDDFIYRHHHDYRSYLADVVESAELEGPIPYDRYYMECVEEPIHHKRIIKKAFIDTLSPSDRGGKQARADQQSRTGSHRSLRAQTLFVLPQTVTSREDPDSVVASESASNVLKIAPSVTSKHKEASKTTPPPSSLQDQLHRKEQAEAKKQSQESSVEEWLECAGGSPELGTPVDPLAPEVPAKDLTEESETDSELVREKTVFQNFLDANSRLGAERRIWASKGYDCIKQVRPEVQSIIDIFSWRR